MHFMPETKPPYQIDENPTGGGRCCIAFRTRRLARLAARSYENELKDTGLTVQQFSVLNVLGLRGPISVGDLATILDLEKSTMSRNILLLRNKDLIATFPDGAGRNPLTLTQKGRRVLATALPRWQNAQLMTLDAIGNDGSALIDRMTAALEGNP